jgi:SPX domain
MYEDSEDGKPNHTNSVPLRIRGVSFISFASRSSSTVHEYDRDSYHKPPALASKGHEFSTSMEHDISSPGSVAFDNSNPIVIADSLSPALRTRPLSPITAFLPLSELLPLLPPSCILFFNALDKELEKVDMFYLDREAEMKSRSAQLEEQLGELFQHQVVHVSGFFLRG